MDLTYVPITGPGVDALENRKETGSLREITEAEMRESYERVRDDLFAGLKMLRGRSSIV